MFELYPTSNMNQITHLVYGVYRSSRHMMPSFSTCSSFVRVWDDVDNGDNAPCALYHGGHDYHTTATALRIMSHTLRHGVKNGYRFLYADMCVWRGGLCQVVACCVVNRFAAGVSFMSWRDALDMFDNELLGV